MLSNQVFYVGLLDGNPAYLNFTEGSLTCELFRDIKTAKKKFRQIASVRIEPTIKVIGYDRFEYSDLSEKLRSLEQRFNELRRTRTTWWLEDKWTSVKTRLVKVGRSIFKLKPPF